jgi:hypothetical protein
MEGQYSCQKYEGGLTEDVRDASDILVHSKKHLEASMLIGTVGAINMKVARRNPTISANNIKLQLREPLTPTWPT